MCRNDGNCAGKISANFINYSRLSLSSSLKMTLIIVTPTREAIAHNNWLQCYLHNTLNDSMLSALYIWIHLTTRQLCSVRSVISIAKKYSLSSAHYCTFKVMTNELCMPFTSLKCWHRFKCFRTVDWPYVAVRHCSAANATRSMHIAYVTCSKAICLGDRRPYSA